MRLFLPPPANQTKRHPASHCLTYISCSLPSGHITSVFVLFCLPPPPIYPAQLMLWATLSLPHKISITLWKSSAAGVAGRTTRGFPQCSWKNYNLFPRPGMVFFFNAVIPSFSPRTNPVAQLINGVPPCHPVNWKLNFTIIQSTEGEQICKLKQWQRLHSILVLPGTKADYDKKLKQGSPKRGAKKHVR